METNQNTNQTEQKALNAFEAQPDPKPQGAPYIKDGDQIDVNAVANIEDKEFQFDDKVVKRKVLTMKDKTQVVIPISLNNELISLCKANKGKVGKVQVKVEGIGKQKKYRAIPIL